MSKEQTQCPAQHALRLLQEKWVLHIVSSLLAGPRGFNELSRAVGGCNPTTLAHRLERLEKAGLVTKTICSTMPPRTRYELTEGGRALESVINAIDEWASRYLQESEETEAASPDQAPSEPATQPSR